MLFQALVLLSSSMSVFNLSIAAVVFVLFSGWSRVIFWLSSLSLCHPADVLAPESCSLKCYQPCVTYFTDRSRVQATDQVRAGNKRPLLLPLRRRTAEPELSVACE